MAGTKAAVLKKQKVLKKLPIWSTIKEAFGLYTKHFKLFILISATLYALPAILNFIPSKDNPGLALIKLPFVIVGVIISLWGAIALITAIATIYANKQTGYKQSFGLAWPKIWPYFVNSMLLALILIPAYALIIIPGVYFSIIYAFVTIAVILEDHKKVSPFKMSAALVKNYFWNVFLYFLAVALTYLPIIILCIIFVAAVSLKAFAVNPVYSLVLQVVEAVAVPYLLAANFMLYSKLKKLKRTAPELKDKKALAPHVNGCLVSAGLIILYILIGVAIFFIFRLHFPHS
jgi:hypothetical protein